MPQVAPGINPGRLRRTDPEKPVHPATISTGTVATVAPPPSEELPTRPPPGKYARYATHIPALARAVAACPKDKHIVETGCGYYSTLLIDALQGDDQLHVIIEPETPWWARIQPHLTGNVVRFNTIDDYLASDFCENVGVVFVDSGPGTDNRAKIIQKIFTHGLDFDTMVVHDCNPPEQIRQKGSQKWADMVSQLEDMGAERSPQAWTPHTMILHKGKMLVVERDSVSKPKTAPAPKPDKAKVEVDFEKVEALVLSRRPADWDTMGRGQKAQWTRRARVQARKEISEGRSD